MVTKLVKSHFMVILNKKAAAPLIIGGVFVLDRILKLVAQTNTTSKTLIPRLLNFEFYQNFRGPFSLPIPLWAIIAVSVMLIIILLILIYSKPKFRLPLVLIIAGALSNLFDRIFYGYTIDTFNFLNFSFFNLADGLIFAGIIWLICKIFKKE